MERNVVEAGFLSTWDSLPTELQIAIPGLLGLLTIVLLFGYISMSNSAKTWRDAYHENNNYQLDRRRQGR